MNERLRYSINQTLRVVVCAYLLVVSGYVKAEDKPSGCSFSHEIIKNGEIQEITLIKPANCITDACNQAAATVDETIATVTTEGDCLKVYIKTEADPKMENYRLYADDNVRRLDRENSGYDYKGDWPEDEYTVLIPKPDLPFPCSTVLLHKKSSAFYLTVLCGNKDDVQILNPAFVSKKTKAYIKKLKAKGFTIGAEQLEQINSDGSVSIAYTAKNSKGYFVRVLCIGSFCSVGLENPVAVSEKENFKETLHNPFSGLLRRFDPRND